MSSMLVWPSGALEQGEGVGRGSLSPGSADPVLCNPGEIFYRQTAVEA